MTIPDKDFYRLRDVWQKQRRGLEQQCREQARTIVWLRRATLLTFVLGLFFGMAAMVIIMALKDRV